VAIERYARQVGEILYAWNELQSALFGVFWGLTETNDTHSHEIALAIWHSFQSDRAQREMLLAVAEAKLPPRSRAITSIRWLKRATDELAIYRNDAAHTPIGTTEPIGPDYFVTRQSVIARFVEKSPETVWRRVRGDLLRLAEFAEAIQFSFGALQPLPRRPRLLIVPPQKRRGRRRSRDRT
jgi:hypothetical protein